jgi:hypothetical protein
VGSQRRRPALYRPSPSRMSEGTFVIGCMARLIPGTGIGGWEGSLQRDRHAPEARVKVSAGYGRFERSSTRVAEEREFASVGPAEVNHFLKAIFGKADPRPSDCRLCSGSAASPLTQPLPARRRVEVL